MIEINLVFLSKFEISISLKLYTNIQNLLLILLFFRKGVPPEKGAFTLLSF